MRRLVFIFLSVSLVLERGNTAFCGNENCCIECCGQAAEQYFAGLISPLLFAVDCITSCADIVLSCDNLLPLSNLACRLALSMKNPNSPVFTFTDSFNQVRSLTCVVSEDNPLVGLVLEVPASPETVSPAPQSSQSPTVSVDSVNSTVAPSSLTVSPMVSNDTDTPNDANLSDRSSKEVILIAVAGSLGAILILSVIGFLSHRQCSRKGDNILESSESGEENHRNKTSTNTPGVQSKYEASEVKLMGDDIADTVVIPDQDVLLVHAHEL